MPGAQTWWLLLVQKKTESSDDETAAQREGKQLRSSMGMMLESAWPPSPPETPLAMVLLDAAVGMEANVALIVRDANVELVKVQPETRPAGPHARVSLAVVDPAEGKAASAEPMERVATTVKHAEGAAATVGPAEGAAGMVRLRA